MRREEGAAIVELAIVLPLLLLLAAAIAPLLALFADYNAAEGAVASGVRYATKVDRNAHSAADSTDCPLPSRRRSEAQVQQHVARTSRGIVPDGAVVVAITDPRAASAPDLCTALSGAVVRIEATYTRRVTELGQVANSIARLFGGDPIFVERRRTVSAEGVLE